MSVTAIQDPVFNTVTIEGTQNTNLDRRLAVDSEASGGSLHQTAHHELAGYPMLGGTTRDILALYHLLKGNADTPYVALTAFDGYAALANPAAPGYTAGSVHRKYVAAAGGIFLNSLTWSPDGKAEMGYQAFFTSALGTTDPITFTDNNALPAAAIFTNPCVLTSLTVGGQTVNEIGRYDLQVAHGAENNVASTCKSLGLPFPTVLAMPGAHGPIAITCTVDTPDILLAPTTGDVIAVFKPLLSGGGLGTETLTATLNGEVESTQGYDASTGSPQTTGFVCRGVWDGVSKPLTLVTA